MSIGLRVIVCGGCDFSDWAGGLKELDRIDRERGPIAMVVHGNASGADSVGATWARTNKRQVWPFPAEWAKYGASAGPRRNKQMLGSGATIVIAFPGGKGTRNMVKQAQSAGLEIIHAASPHTPADWRVGKREG